MITWNKEQVKQISMEVKVRADWWMIMYQRPDDVPGSSGNWGSSESKPEGRVILGNAWFVLGNKCSGEKNQHYHLTLQLQYRQLWTESQQLDLWVLQRYHHHFDRKGPFIWHENQLIRYRRFRVTTCASVDFMFTFKDALLTFHNCAMEKSVHELCILSSYFFKNIIFINELKLYRNCD